MLISSNVIYQFYLSKNIELLISKVLALGLFSHRLFIYFIKKLDEKIKKNPKILKKSCFGIMYYDKLL